MFYIDDYNSKAIVNRPPQKQQKFTPEQKEKQNDMLNLFWYTMGVTIAEKFDSMQNILNKYGFSVSTEQEATTAVNTMAFGKDTKRWQSFLNDVSGMMNDTLDAKFPAFAGK